MRGIRKTFGATIALDNVDFAVSAGEIHALIGENGAGKSTLMKVLSGALQPDAGEMTVDGSPFAPANPLQARQQGVVMIYQELSLAPHLTVVENVLLGMEITRRGLLQKSDMQALVQNALAELDHADIDPHARVSTLMRIPWQVWIGPRPPRAREYEPYRMFTSLAEPRPPRAREYPAIR